MEQILESPKKQYGQVPKGFKQTVIQLPPDLLKWAKHQPEGLAGLTRQLLKAKRERRAQDS